MATSLHGCDTAYSDWCIVNVYDSLLIQTNEPTPLCYMGSDTISVSASGAGDAYSYQWQELAGGEWQNATGVSNDSIYTVSSKEGNTYQYRCIVTPLNDCLPDTSDVISVLVYKEVKIGEIELIGLDTVCYNDSPGTLSLKSISGGNGYDYQYQWWYKEEGMTDFTPMQGKTESTLTIGKLQKTTEYQLEIQDPFSAPKLTNSIRIYVRDPLQRPMLEPYTSWICNGKEADPIQIRQFPQGGIDDSFDYKWFESENGKNFKFVGNDTIYYPGILLKTKYYYLEISSDKCGTSLRSDTIKVNVYDVLSLTTSEPYLSSCYMKPFTLSVKAKGSDGQYSYQWQQWDGTQFTNIQDETNESYTTNRTEGTYRFKCVVTTALCEDATESPDFSALVYSQLNPGTIKGTDSVCAGYAPEEPLQVDVKASGAEGEPYLYQWQDSIAGGKWRNVIVQTKYFLLLIY